MCGPDPKGAESLLDLDTVCAHVASGGSLIDICKMKGLSYPDALRWVYDPAEPSRKEFFERALRDRTEWVIEKILRELRTLADTNIKDAYAPNGDLLPIADMPEPLQKAISSVESAEEFEGRGNQKEKVAEVRKVKLWDKLRALELLGRNLKLFTDRLEHEAGKTLEELVMGSRAKHEETEKPQAG